MSDQHDRMEDLRRRAEGSLRGFGEVPKSQKFEYNPEIHAPVKESNPWYSTWWAVAITTIIITLFCAWAAHKLGWA